VAGDEGDCGLMLTHRRLKEALHYNLKTGIFTWKINIFRRKNKGKKAGGLSGKYIVVSLDGKSYYAHRLAWFYVTGKWPKKQIDHKNRNKLDNRFHNFRDVPDAKNRQNRILRANQGVVWDRFRGKWKASIQVNGSLKNLGRFDCYKKAVSVRKAAEKQYEFFP
jgi:hypothetical protein